MVTKKRLLLVIISFILVLGLLMLSLIALFTKDKPTYPEDTMLNDDKNEAEGVREDLMGENETEGAGEDLAGKNETESLVVNPIGEGEETSPLRPDEYYTVIAAGVASNGEAYLVGRGFVAYRDGYIDNYTNSFIIPGGNGITVFDSPGGECIFSLFIQP